MPADPFHPRSAVPTASSAALERRELEIVSSRLVSSERRGCEAGGPAGAVYVHAGGGLISV